MDSRRIRKIARKYECEQILKKDREFDEKMQRTMQHDDFYATAEDIDLTDEQKAEVDAFWKPYEFAFKAPYITAKTYMNRVGKFDPSYIPFGVRNVILAPYIKDDNYCVAFQNKAYLGKIYSGIKQPKIVCRKIEGIYYDENYNHITRDEAVQLCKATLERTEIVIKPSGLCGGAGVVFLKEATEGLLKEEFKKIPKLMVVQEAIKQHPKMAELNPTTVNTVRLTTYMNGSEVVPLAALIKIGNAGVRVDNYKHGGHILGVNLDGKAQTWALNVERQRVTVLPTGIDLSQGMEIPGFDNVIKTAVKAHYQTPRMKTISWDIAIDETAEAVIIEANFGGDWRMHHAVTGSLFGDLTKDFLNQYMVKRFHRERADFDFNFNEYFEYVEITKYAGLDKKVVVPEKINDKPVKVIGENAFSGNDEVVAIKLSGSVKEIKTKAFANCKNLRSVTGGENLEKIAEVVFINSPKFAHKYNKNLRAIAKKNKKK